MSTFVDALMAVAIIITGGLTLVAIKDWRWQR